MRVQSKIFFLFGVCLGFTILFLWGCDKSNPVDVSILESNLFPLAPGRYLVYSEYSLDTTSQARIDSTVHRHVTFVKDTVTFSGKKGFFLLDSIYTPTGTISAVETSYAAIENGDLYLAFDNAWAVVFKKSAGLNSTYDVRTYIDQSQGFPLSVVVKGTIHPKELVSTLAGTFEAYKLEFKSSVNLGISTLDIVVFIYFADGAGIVKQTTLGFSNPITHLKEQGSEMVLQGRNF